jgi:TolB protein
MGKPAWLRKGRSIAVAAASSGLNRAKLVEISLPGGEISEIPRDLANYRDVDSTPDSQRIVAVQHDSMSGIWTVPLFDQGNADQGNARPITQPTGRFSGVTWTKSGKLVSQTENAGRPDLWSVDPATGDLRPITEDDFVERYPTASPDGKYLVYTSNRDGTFHLWRSGQNGSGAVRLTSDDFMEAEQPVFTPDSQWVIYTSARGGSRALWKVSIEGGKPIQITHALAAKPSVSPDGTLIACEYSQNPEDGWTVAIVRAKTGELVRTFPNLPTGDGPPNLWSPNGRNLLYLVTHSGVSNIWSQPVSGGSPRQLTHFTEQEIFSFALSPDGRSLASVRGRTTSDVVLVEARR